MFKKNKHLILELVLIFFISLTYNLICNKLDFDEIWNYGFSYNIASGLIPYKDFNMVITPLFPILGAIFLYLFGKNIVVYYIFNALICTSIFYYMKKCTPKNYYLVFQVVLIVSMANYNLFCLLLLYILMNLEEEKANDYLIGIILGITFITKQNIGLYLCIPTLFTKDIKKIIKRIIGFIIPNIVMILYLLMNDCLYEFIDYTVLGMGSFAKENIIIYPFSAVIVVSSIVYLIYKYIKTKDIKLIYILCFQGMVFPIFNTYHIAISIIPTIAYIINNINMNHKIIKCYFIAAMSMLLLLSTYEIIKGEYKYPNDTINYKYKKIENVVVSTVTELSENIKKTEGNVFIIDEIAYLLKLESSLPINKYDLLNEGNLGQGGRKQVLKEIDETCKEEKCTFIINKNQIKSDKYNQYHDELYFYVIDNYKEIAVIRGFSIYKNY